MSKMLIALGVVVMFATLTFAQGPAQRAAAAKLPPSTTTCSLTFSSGSGHNQTIYCVTANGNVARFSRGGNEYIQAGVISEGYGVCDFTAGVAYFDYAANESGNWGPSSLTQPNLKTAVVTRQTADGIWKLTQTITQVPAKPTAPGQAIVKMAIKNQSGVARTIEIMRHADVDAPGAANDFDWTIDTATGLAQGFRTGLSSVNNTFTFAYDAFAQNTFNGPAPCNAFANEATQPDVVDGSIEQLWLMSVPAGATRTVQQTYNPI